MLIYSLFIRNTVPEAPAKAIRQEKEIKAILIEKEKLKLTLLTDENLRQLTK
jgi:hypothetical protein